MDRFYQCDAADISDVVDVINMDHNAQLYGIDTVSSGIRNIQIKRITATLNGEFPNSRVIGHRVNNKFIGFGVMYMWPGMPAWSIPIAYTSCEYLATEKLAHSYGNIVRMMMDLAESENVYNYYYVAAYTKNIKADGYRFRQYGREDLFPRYEYFYEEIVPPYGSSKYEIFQQLMVLVAGKNRRPLAIVRGNCKKEYRSYP